MYQEAEQASPGFVALIWTNEINIALQKARKYQQLWTSRYSKILSLNAKLDQLLPAIAARIAKPIVNSLLLASDRVQKVLSSSESDIQVLDKFDARFNELAAALNASTGIAPIKDCAYLKWKYETRPDLNVTILAAFDKDAVLSGFAVVTDPDPIYRTSFIAELAASNNSSRTSRQLLDAVIARARERGADRLVSVATNYDYSRLLKSRLFFVRGPRDPLFIANAERSEKSELILDVDNWHMCLGDSEGPF